MSNLVCTAAEKWCQPIVGKMHELLLAGNIIHADETTVQVLHEEGRKPTSVSNTQQSFSKALSDILSATGMMPTMPLKVQNAAAV